ncbi:MAG: Gfo/Idh/MocA family oxidoreductase [Actinobacteria bacterium]|nr:Gfo/Idh/MocA family oxidoreductase [Actinomycetota bacterium]
MAKTINIGLVGYGFMGKAHSFAYRNVSNFYNINTVPVMKAICGRDEEAVKRAAKVYGWGSYETSWEKLVKRNDIDLIDIVTPNADHKDVAIAASRAGKHILCEKPLATNFADAKEMLEAAQASGKKHMICFNYQKAPAIGLVKKLIEDGYIGKIYHFRAEYLLDYLVDPNVPLGWQLKKEVSGAGAHGNVNPHIINMARYLVGDVEKVVGMQETFIKERPIPVGRGSAQLGIKASKELDKVTVDDATLFLAKFKNGALGSFEASWLANGHKNGQKLEINGSKGSIIWHFEDMNILWFYSIEDPKEIRGFRRIQATEPEHPYMEAWWPVGHIIGYENTFINLIYDFMKAIDEDVMPFPSFVDGVECQRVLEAVEKSIIEQRWIEVDNIK